MFGPPKNRAAALAVLKEAVASGVNHIDTGDFYGPHVTNQLIREALHPYPRDLTIVTKIGARRGGDASWIPAFSREDLIQAVHDNLRNLGLEALEVVNYRCMGEIHGPAEGSIEPQITVLAELQRQGLIRHIGISTATPTQIAEAQKICQIVCVQNLYNVAQRSDERSSTSLPAKALHMCLTSRSAVFRRCSRRPFPRWRNAWARPQCRSLSPGCCIARPISC